MVVHDEIKTESNKLEKIPSCGYKLIDYFSLPEDAHWAEYYRPLEIRIKEIAKKGGATVIRNEKNSGVTKATQKGFEAANGDIIITMDADGQHEPSDIPKLIEPLKEGKGEMALGLRDEIPHRSERIINALVNLSVKCSDTGTGFRAIKADLAKKMKLHGTCLCRTFVLEAHKHGARIVEIPVQTRPRTYGKRKVRTRHVRQIFYVLKDLILTVHGAVPGFFFVSAFSIMTQAVL